MKFKRNVEIVKGRPDLTALVNVVLLMLFFFLLGSSFVQQPGIKIDLPQSRLLATLPYKNLVVMIAADDEVFFKDTKLTLDQLRRMLQQEAQRTIDQQVVIEADSRVSYKTIVEVMDMAFQCRFRAVNLATRTEPAPPVRRK